MLTILAGSRPPTPSSALIGAAIAWIKGHSREFAAQRGIPAPGRVTRMPDEVELTIVTMLFDSIDPVRLQSVLANYVVMSRGQPGCRNIDLCLSATAPTRFVIIEKWETPDAQRAHFDSPAMVEMARSCDGLLTAPPVIDLLEPISAHDLA